MVSVCYYKVSYFNIASSVCYSDPLGMDIHPRAWTLFVSNVHAWAWISTHRRGHPRRGLDIHAGGGHPCLGWISTPGVQAGVLYNRLKFCCKSPKLLYLK